MPLRLEGKTALVIGAGSRAAGWGNGKAAAVLFAREGAKVAAVDINPEAAEETRAIIEAEGNVAIALAGDATDSGDMARVAAQTVDAFGKIDVLHNNVGAPAPGSPVEMPEDVWRANMAVNVGSAFMTTKHVLPVMAENGGGVVVNVASIAGIKNLERSLVGYQAGKAALIQLTRSIGAQWGPRGVRANCVLPGLMKTPLVLDRINSSYDTAETRQAALDERERMVPMGFMGDAWDTAYASLFLASDESNYINCTELVVDGGITAGRPLDWRDPEAVAPPVPTPDAEARSVPAPQKRFEGKAVIVVGAGSLGPGWGNGKASAVQFAREGAWVLAVDINGDAAAETRSIIEGEGGVCINMTADVLDEAAVEAVIRKCVDAFGRLDVLHNNVGGSGGPKGPASVSAKDWCANVLLNVRPAFLGTKFALPVMERQGGGAIVNTGSISGISVPEHPMSSYQTGKAGLIQFSRGVALEYARVNIRSNVVIPGKIKTPMTQVRQGALHDAAEVEEIFKRRARSVPLGCMGEAWDIAHAAAFLASDEARYITAAELVVDGGLTANCC